MRVSTQRFAARGRALAVVLGTLGSACQEAPATLSKSVAAPVAVASPHVEQAASVAALAQLSAPKRTPVWSLEGVGLSAPESVCVDVARSVYLVSNVVGDPTHRDDNGFISRVSPDGKLLKLKWINGASQDVTLHAPKGMAVANDTLYVADIDTLRRFDAVSGRPKGAQPIEGATFLNDVTVGVDGAIYVSDSGAESGAVYRVDSDGVEVVARGASLLRPNGLWADETGLWTVTLGGAELYEISSGEKRDVHALGASHLDGIAKTVAGRWLVTSWDAHAIVDATEGAGVGVMGELQSPADFAIDLRRNRVVVPCMQADAVYAFAL